MIEMVRNAREAKGRDRFACPETVWSLLQQIGTAYGWRAKGTTYLAPPELQAAQLSRHDYVAGGLLDRKEVDDDDAKAWARALDSAQKSDQLHALVTSSKAASEVKPIQTLHSLIYEFTEFAYAGAFTFGESQMEAPVEAMRLGR